VLARDSWLKRLAGRDLPPKPVLTLSSSSVCSSPKDDARERIDGAGAGVSRTTTTGDDRTAGAAAGLLAFGASVATAAGAPAMATVFALTGRFCSGGPGGQLMLCEADRSEGRRDEPGGRTGARTGVAG
jgi:hypothetical protein